MNIVPQEFVVASDNGVFTDSRTVAKRFDKPHKNVIRDVRSLLRQLPESAKLNFELCCEISSLQNGKPQPVFRMTKDAFMLLAMGFTGAKALAIKLAFIEAFNRMAEFIRAQAMQAFDAFNVAYQQHLSDKRHVSESARNMRRWQDVKPQQLQTLAALHPQMSLALN